MCVRDRRAGDCAFVSTGATSANHYVQNIVQAAVNSVNVDMVVRYRRSRRFVLGVFRTQNAPATALGNFGQTQNANDVAVALARTGAFFSNDEAPLSSRTVRFISGIHFPPES